ncbi:MAG: class I SAM-dependent methyltransferase [Myxococcales bacterium]|nr:class I SAM-dependent methyltransferase [Myxococcales bacterium]
MSGGISGNPEMHPCLRVLERTIADNGEALERVACPLCGETNATVALEARDRLYGTPNRYPVVRCEGCSLAYVNPRPTPEALGAHYPNDYHCYRTIDSYPKWLQPMARQDVIDQTKRRLKNIERVLGPIQPDMQLLDVGCGQNALLHFIKEERGATGLGIEMKAETAARVREQLGMPIVEGTLLDAGLEAARFDLVVMLNYLEHEPDPLRALRESRRVLKPGGHVAIEIPDPEGLPARLFGKHWVNLDVPRHLVFFDRNTIERALQQAGFELVSYRRFALPAYVGLNFLLTFGAHNIMRYWNTASATGYVLGLPFLPAMPWLPEFSFVVAKAIETEPKPHAESR